MMKNALKRLIALILALAMCLSLLSANVWAAESSGADLTEQSNDISEAEQSVPLAEETAPEAEASAVPEAEAETEEQSAEPETDKQKGKEPKPEGVKTQAIMASGECGAQGDNLTWTLDSDGTLTISGSGAMENYINAPWAWSGIIKKLIIQDGVTSIGNSVFEGCSSLTSVTIGNSVISIGDSAFKDCTSLTSVDIPDSVTQIWHRAFENCSSLSSINLPTTIPCVEACTFMGCTSLISVRIPESVGCIYSSAFQGCSSLERVIIPHNCGLIDQCAFQDCYSLKEIYFCGLTSLMYGCFIHVTATAYYPQIETGYTKGDYGGTITWVEWNPEEEISIRYALTPDQVWGFNMRGLGKLKLKHYYKFFPIPCFSEWLLEQDDGGNGFCAGFVTSAIAASGYDSPPAYSFVKNGSRVIKLNEIKSSDFISEVNGMSAADFIKYAYVYQNTPLTILEKNSHANDIKKLYSAIVKSINQNGEYVEIHMRGPYKGETEGHVVLAMGIAQDNENSATVKVYDGNFPDELKELRLFKNTNGWSYNVSGFLNWGDDKEGAFISYTTSGKDFARDLFTYPSSIDLIAYNSMMSVKSKDAKVSINNAKSIDLNNNGDDDILEMNTSKITLGNNNPVNNNTLYWLKNANDIAIYNGSNSNTVSIASTKGAVSVSFPEQSTLTINNSSGEENASISNLKKDAKVIIEFIHYFDETSSKLIIDGTATGSVTAVENEDKTISISGITYADVKKVVNDDTVDETSIESDGRTIGLSVDGEDIVQLDPILEQPEPSPSPAPKPEKQKNTITAKNIVKSYSIKKQTVKLNAKTKGGSKLSYKLNNKKVKVDRNGKATLPAKFSGTVKITITAAATNKYNQATKTITVTVPTATNVKKATAGKGQMTVQWKKNATGRGYEIQYSTDKKFKKGAKIAKIKKNTTLKAIIKKLKKGTWYVRIRTVNGKAYSDWSKAKALKVTK